MIPSRYPPPEGNGYEAAYLEALGPCGEGLHRVLSQIAETVKATQRWNHENWVWRALVSALDGRIKRDVATCLINRIGAAKDLQGPPDRFANNLKDLFQIIIDMRGVRPRVLDASTLYAIR